MFSQEFFQNNFRTVSTKTFGKSFGMVLKNFWSGFDKIILARFWNSFQKNWNGFQKNWNGFKKVFE
jgi:hypothetical protein